MIPQGCPALCKGSAMHVLDVAEQKTPSSGSHPAEVLWVGSHDAPSVLTAVWQVPVTVLVEPTQ